MKIIIGIIFLTCSAFAQEVKKQALEKIDIILINKVTGTSCSLTAKALHLVTHETITVRASNLYYVTEVVPIVWAFIEAWYICPKTKNTQLLIAQWINNLNYISIHKDYDLGIKLSDS